jgi:hypothetical protein
MEYIPSYCAPAVHWGLPPATRLVGRKILMEQNIKRRTGTALYIFSLLGIHTHCMGILVDTFDQEEDGQLYIKLCVLF